MIRRSHFRLTSIAAAAAAPLTTAPAFSRAFLREHLSALRAEQKQVHETLAVLNSKHNQIEARVTKHLDHWAVGGFLYLVAQTGLLFHWVYYRFDWNLVEPITYLLGYSVVWLSIACFFRTGQEFSYDSIRSLVGDRKRRQLWSKSGGESLETYVVLKTTEAELARRIAQLEESAL